MELSPGGNTIERVAGSPEEIIDRGQAVIDLGQMMTDSADLLDSIKNRAVDGGEMTGNAINALKDVIGDSYEQLREAGDLYSPVGPVIKTYGEQLDRLQPLIEAVVAECETLWTTLNNTPDPGSRPADYDDDPCVASAYDQQVKDLEDAQSAWETKAAEFDRLYNGDCDSWEYVFDQAVTGIGNEMSGQIKDSWWDKWGSDLFALLGDILAIAGLIVAIFFPGAWIAALVIGLAALAVTAVQFHYGEKSGWDLALAAFSAVPFGKMGSLVADGNKYVLFATEGRVVNQMAIVMTPAADLLQYGAPVFQNAHRAMQGGQALQNFNTLVGAVDAGTSIWGNASNVWNNPDMPVIGTLR